MSADTPSKPLRKRRFARCDAPATFTLTNRDLDAVRHVARFRMLDADQLSALLPGSPEHLRRRLRLLFDGNFLARPPAQITTLIGWRSMPTVYALAQRGAQLLTEFDGIPLDHLDWQLKNARAGTLFIDHTLRVADIMIAVHKAARQAGTWQLVDHFDLLPSFPARTDARGKRNPFSLSVDIDGEDHAVVPDRLFSLHAGSLRLNFALEYDAGTMPLHRPASNGTSLTQKIRHYFKAWQDRSHQAAWGFRQFRCLIVTSPDERIRNLQMLAARLNLLPNLHTTLFLLTTPQHLAEHGAFAPIWQTLDGSPPISILESIPQPVAS